MAKLTEALRRRFEGIEEERKRIAKGEDPSSWIPTKLKRFDKWGGHKRKQISLYGSDTGGGKSLWTLHLMWAAASSGYSVSLLSMEDAEERTADRVFARATMVDSAAMLSGDLTDKQIQQIGLALADSEDWSDNVEFEPGIKTGREALEWLNDNPADLEIVDYLSAFPHGAHGREREISDFLWGWTKHVQEHNSAGVALAQLSDKVAEQGLEQYRNAQRFNRQEQSDKPNLAPFRAYDTHHLMWCKDAGKVCKETGFMFRPGRVLKRLGIKSKDDVMEFNFPKRNWGDEGLIRVGIDLKTARFYDLADKGAE